MSIRSQFPSVWFLTVSILQSEYSAASDERRHFLSGFTGSAGTAVVTKDKALLWTDGRYFLQVIGSTSLFSDLECQKKYWLLNDVDGGPYIVWRWETSVSISGTLCQGFSDIDHKKTMCFVNVYTEAWRIFWAIFQLGLCVSYNKLLCLASHSQIWFSWASLRECFGGE